MDNVSPISNILLLVGFGFRWSRQYKDAYAFFSHVGNCMEMEQNWKGDEFNGRIICAYAENYMYVKN